MNYVLLLCFLVSFVTVIVTVPLWIRKAKVNHIVGRDIHKLDKRKVAEMGGLTVIVGFLFGTLAYVGITTYFPFREHNHLLTLGILCSILITTIIGIIDDILGWKVGLRQYQKPILTIAAAIPIAILFTANSTILIPLVGELSFGIWYSLLIVPLIIVVTTNGFNMLAGYNGLESGMGVIMLSVLGLLALVTGSYWAGIIAFIMVFALLGFLANNYYPARVFPGDSLTYSVGALIGIVAVVANIERALFLLLVPYVIEFFLKLRGRFQKESFSKLRKDGGLYVEGIYGLEHLVVWGLGKIKKKVTEQNVVHTLWLMEILIAVAVWGLYT